jgi:hypothetical protein
MCCAALALGAGYGLNRQFPDGARGHGWSLMSEKGCQPTARLFMKACRTLGIQQVFTSNNHPKANADTERVIAP